MEPLEPSRREPSPPRRSRRPSASRGASRRTSAAPCRSATRCSTTCSSRCSPRATSSSRTTRASARRRWRARSRRSIDCQFARVQCTADLLPADIVGTNVYNQREQRFEFRPGPIFANVVLVDEINRASPKTQSGLLECMQERHVTVDAHVARARAPVPRLRDAEPGRVRGHLPAARGAGRPLHGPPLARLSRRRRRGRHARRPRGRRPRARARAGRRPRRGARAQDAAMRVHASRALRDYIVALLRAHPRRPARRARRLAARRPDAAARRQGARARSQGRDHALPDDVQALAPAGARAPADAGARGGGDRAGDDRDRRRRPRRRRSRGRGVRSARIGCAGLGLLLLLVAGTFDAEPLYVTGSALVLLGAGAAAWIGLGARGARVERTISRAQRRRGGAAAGRDRRLRPAACRCRRAGSTSRCCPSPCASRRPPARPRARRGHVRPPRPARARAALARAARPVRARPARRARRARRRGARAAAHLAGRRHRRRGRRDGRARARRADRRGGDRDRRPAPVRATARPPRASTGRRWPRGAGLMERKLISEADSRPLVVLDPRAPTRPRSRSTPPSAPPLADAALRRAARAARCCCRATAARRSSSPTCCAWPQAHVRLALIGRPHRPVAGRRAEPPRPGRARRRAAARPPAARARAHARRLPARRARRARRAAAPCSRSPAATATSARARQRGAAGRRSRQRASSAAARLHAGARDRARTPRAARRCRCRARGIAFFALARLRRRCTGWRCSSPPCRARGRARAADRARRRWPRCRRAAGCRAAGARRRRSASRVVALALALLAGGVADELLRPTRWGELAAGSAAASRRCRACACPTAGSTSGSRIVIPARRHGAGRRRRARSRSGRGAAALGLPALALLAARRALRGPDGRARLRGRVPARRGAGAARARLPAARAAARCATCGSPARLAVVVVRRSGCCRAALDNRTRRGSTTRPGRSRRLDLARSTTFSWNHTYGPLHWPRDGRELLRVQRQAPGVLEGREPRRLRRPPLGRTATTATRPTSPAAGLRRPRSAGRRTSASRSRNLRTPSSSPRGYAFDVPTRRGTSRRWTGDGTFGAPRTLRRGDAYTAAVYSPQPTEARAPRRAAVRRPDRLAATCACGCPTAAAAGRTRHRQLVHVPALRQPPAAPIAARRRRPRSGDHAMARDVLERGPYAGVWQLAQRLKRGTPRPEDYVAKVAGATSAAPLHLHRVAAAGRAEPRRLPVRRQDRLLPAVLRRDGAAAAHGRHPGARVDRLHLRRARPQARTSTSCATSTRTRGSRSGTPASAGSRSTRRRPPPRRAAARRARRGTGPSGRPASAPLAAGRHGRHPAPAAPPSRTAAPWWRIAAAGRRRGCSLVAARVGCARPAHPPAARRAAGRRARARAAPHRPARRPGHDAGGARVRLRPHAGGRGLRARAARAALRRPPRRADAARSAAALRPELGRGAGLARPPARVVGRCRRAALSRAPLH